MKRPSCLLWYLIVGSTCGLSLNVVGEDVRAREDKGAILVYAKGAAGEKMYFQEDPLFYNGVGLMIRPLKLPDGSFQPPDATCYWRKMDQPGTPGPAEIEKAFPMIKTLPGDQRATSIYYTNVKEGSYVISAWLPDHSEPLTYVVRYVEPGQVYHIDVPPFDFLSAVIPDDLRIDGKIPDREKWMFIARDVANPRDLVTAYGNSQRWSLWVAKGHTYEGWVATKKWIVHEGRYNIYPKIAGYRIARFKICNDLHTDDVIHLRLLGLDKPPAEIHVDQ